MRAWVATEYGDLDVMALREVEKPKVSKGKILIEIEYAALNPYDYKLRDGLAKWMTGKHFPKIFGGDFAGKIIESQTKNKSFRKGQWVYGFANIFFGGQGSLAEYTVISPKYVRPLPEGIKPIDACAVVSAGLTGINGLQKCGNLNNKKILINGATGGIGHLVTQIAVAKEGIVTAVCSSNNFGFAKELGAKNVIDYKTEDVFSEGIRYDIIYDAAAKLTYSEAKNYLEKSGIYCTTEEGLRPTTQVILSKLNSNSTMYLSSFRGRMNDFKELESMMISNKLKPVIYKTFSLEDAGHAFELLEKGGFNGKILMKIKNE